MKKISLLMIILVTMLSHVYSDNENLVFFNGIGSEIGEYDDSLLVPMETQLDIVHNSIEEHRQGNADDLVIIGHSQGALRAVSYAKYDYIKSIDNEGAHPHIDTIITIGGPIRGFSPPLFKDSHTSEMK